LALDTLKGFGNPFELFFRGELIQRFGTQAERVEGICGGTVPLSGFGYAASLALPPGRKLLESNAGQASHVVVLAERFHTRANAQIRFLQTVGVVDLTLNGPASKHPCERRTQRSGKPGEYLQLTSDGSGPALDIGKRALGTVAFANGRAPKRLHLTLRIAQGAGELTTIAGQGDAKR
jgi:hypothetical protein